ncbi:hypothetical protein GCM10007276_26670 [Agaricicola taiwanensis]|uniref:Uncharacterized protein n=1 Tax=Agaricicola taiwanensis TaxID=591372 RepID=A0A8J2YK66_9RHOB|nr:hypothetical protein [Agaricicola taiwanensis]GGE48098.1 hypothetical protein GCM10007276_26670 [Agaricicola taiwanensis]
MANETDIWRPGSFTKNFSWGKPSAGLSELHEIIRLGFTNEMKDVPREEFRGRVRSSGRPDYIPINFFLFNKTVDGVNLLCADELVFQALNYSHSPRFDKLALFAFILSLAGRWTGARAEQRRPALWANAYVKEHIAGILNWQTKLVSADDIENFVKGDPRYRAETTRKLATNLNYLFIGGRLSEMDSARIERWWVDCLFLALDRIVEDRLLDRKATSPSDYGRHLERYGFMELTGKATLEKKLAIKHLVNLYDACGGRSRFSEKATKERTGMLLPDIQFFVANDPRPRGAVHMTNPRILKSIPPACAMLAKYAGFDDLSPDDLEEFDLEEFVKRKTQAALNRLKKENIEPSMTAEQLMKLMRGE